MFVKVHRVLCCSEQEWPPRVYVCATLLRHPSSIFLVAYELVAAAAGAKNLKIEWHMDFGPVTNDVSFWMLSQAC